MSMLNVTSWQRRGPPKGVAWVKWQSWLIGLGFRRPGLVRSGRKTLNAPIWIGLTDYLHRGFLSG
jgi:hypothetical protein